MSMEFLAMVAYPYKYGSGDSVWRKCGKLWFNKQTGDASLLLLGWPLTVAGNATSGSRKLGARPRPDRLAALGIEAPHLHGDLTVPTGTHNDAEGRPVVDRLWCGFLLTSESEKGTLYSIRIDTLPLVAIKDVGVWLKVDENWKD